MTSITYAMKARDICIKNGWNCDVIRTPKNIGSGCGYSIAVRAQASSVKKLLSENNIPFKNEYQI